MRASCILIPILASSLLACGGSAKKETGTPGNSHTGTTETAPEDIDTPPEEVVPDVAVEQQSAAPVTFVLKNTGRESLFLNMDKGWSAVIYAYSGQPPNAKSILMFPTHCTASCDSAPEDICPVCKEPDKVNDIRAAEKHDEVVPGASREVPWDGMVFKYSKTKGTRDGRKARCKCFDSVEPPPEEYIIKACGLRKTQTAKQSSKYQCVQSSLTLPITEPITVELDFGG